MRISPRSIAFGLVVAGFGLCGVGYHAYRTNQVNQIQPSPYRLREEVVYFPRGPRFPLANELDEVQRADNDRQADVQ